MLDLNIFKKSNMVCIKEEIDTNHYPRDILSLEELEKFKTFKSIKRQKEFLAGRLAAKKSFFQLKQFKQISLDSISILNLPNGTPFIKNYDTNVSISHSHGIAIAAVSPYPIGIDIELINPARFPVLNYAINNNKYQSIEELTIIWSLEEALSKALKTGIITDFSYYSVQDLQHINNVFVSSFKNFESYKGTALIENGYVIAIVQKM